MGVSLYYETEEAASERAVEEIVKEAARLEHSRAWMSEPIYFFDPVKAGHLKGNSKFAPSNWPMEDWSFASWWDFRFILDALARWSHEHNLRWKLSCEGEEVGRIREGEMDKAAREFLRQLAEMGGASSDESANEQRVVEIIRRYESSLQ